MGQKQSTTSSKAGSHLSTKDADFLVNKYPNEVNSQPVKDEHYICTSHPPSLHGGSAHESLHGPYRSSSLPFGGEPAHFYNGRYVLYRPVFQDKVRKMSDPSALSPPYDMYPPYPAPYAVRVDPATGRHAYFPVGVPLHGPPAHYAQYGNNTTVISTFPDPQQDTVRTGSDIRTRPGSTVIRTGGDGVNIFTNARGIATTTHTINNDNNYITNNNEEIVKVTDGGPSGIVVGGETIVPESTALTVTSVHTNGNRDEVFNHTPHTVLLPTKSRDSKYVTYIRDPPRPPTPPVEVEVAESAVQDEAIAEEAVLVTSSAASQIGSVITDGFIEVGDADENLVKILIDDHTAPALSEDLPGERLAVERSPVASTGLEDQSATIAFSDVTRVDLVLLFDAPGAELANRLKEKIEQMGITVWMGSLSHDVTIAEVNEIARAVLEAHMTIAVLTETSVRRRHFKELVSLAKVSNTVMFPAAVDSRAKVTQAMQQDLHLQLGCYKWTQLITEGRLCVEELEHLTVAVQEEFETWRRTDIIDEDYGQVSSWAVRHNLVLRQARQRETFTVQTTVSIPGEGGAKDARLQSEGGSEGQALERQGEGMERREEEEIVRASEFWDEQFPLHDTVPWDKFRAHLRQHYLEKITEHIPRSCMPPVMEMLREELTVKGSGGLVTRDKFIEFCTCRDTDQDVWERICDVAREHQAVMEVFDPDCSVRLTAIEGIGNHGTPTVVSGLRRLLQDPEPDVRSCAALSLSRCLLPGDQAAFSALMAALDDHDWTVRRATCLAMARLGSKQAANRLRRIWRNDKVLLVRKAAASALAQIDGWRGPQTTSSKKSVS